MTDRTTKRNQLTPKPHVTKLSRHRSHKVQSSNTLTRDNQLISLSGKISVTSNQSKSITGHSSIKSSKDRKWLINGSGNTSTVSILPRSYLNRNKVNDYDNENDDLEQRSKQSSLSFKEEKNSKGTDKSKMTSALTMNHCQIITHKTSRIDNYRDLKTTNELTNRINFKKEYGKVFDKKIRKKRKKACKFCRCTRLCILLGILPAILIGVVVAATTVAILNKTNTTTKLTTATLTTMTTVTTTITYVPTGIWDLKIPTCATWNPNGVTVAGNSNGTAGTDVGSLNTPVSIFVDNNYTLYACDRDNHRIMTYAVNVTTGTIAAGTGLSGNSSTQLNQPKGVAVDQNGAIIVGDSSNYRIQRFPVGSLVGTTIAFNSSVNLLGQTRDLHIDVNNNIYVTDSDYSRIVKFYPNNGIGVILAGSAGSGSAPNQFNQPFGNFIDSNQTLFVADYGNQRVQEWLTGATTGTTVAGITGSVGSSLIQLSSPIAVIADNNGYLYIADYGNHRIVRWTTNYTAGGTCIVGCSGSSGVAPTQLRNPRDLKFDASGNLYVSDQGNNRVQMYAIQIPPNCTSSG